MVHINIDSARCKGCGLCERACPKGLIHISGATLNARGYHPAEIADEGACVACAACARTCPDVVITIETD